MQTAKTISLEAMPPFGMRFRFCDWRIATATAFTRAGVVVWRVEKGHGVGWAEARAKIAKSTSRGRAMGATADQPGRLKPAWRVRHGIAMPWPQLVALPVDVRIRKIRAFVTCD